MLRKITLALSAAFLACAPVHAQTGSSKTPTVLNTEVNTLWPDQNSGGITPFNARQTLLDIIASYGNLNQPVGGALTGTLPNPLLGSGVVGTSNLAANAVNNAALATAPADTLKCNPTGVSTTPTDCTLGSGLAFSGSSVISTANSGNIFNVRNSPYNASCNRATGSGAMASSSSTLTAGAIFAPSVVGMYLAIAGAGAGGSTLYTTIATYISATQVTLSNSNASGGAISGKFFEYGSDDTSAFQAAVTAALASGGGTVYIPGGSNCLVSRLNLTNINGLTIRGDGPDASTVYPLQVASYGTATGHMFDLTGSSFVKLENFQIGSFQELATPTTAIFMAQVASGSSNRNGIDHMYVSGQFSGATLYDYGVPSLYSIKDSDFYNYYPGGGAHNCMYLTATNVLTLSSSFATVTSGTQSTSDISFSQVEFHKFAGIGADNTVIMLDAATNIIFTSGVISGGAQYYVGLNGATGYLSFHNVTMETESQPVTPAFAYDIIAGATITNSLDDAGSQYIVGTGTFSTTVTSTTTVHYTK